MLPDDFEHCLVWKSLFVITELHGNIHAGKYCGLSGGALRATFNSQTGVSRNNNAIEDRHWLFILKNGVRFGFSPTIERVEGSAGTNSQSINEEQQQGHRFG